MRKEVPKENKRMKDKINITVQKCGSSEWMANPEATD